MGQRERDRLKVVHEVQQGHLLQWEAARQLKMSERGLRKLLQRMRERGDAGVIHGLRGKASKRRLAAGKAKRVVQLVEREYADFGPTLASEYLEREHGLKLSRESLRQLLILAGRWKVRPRKVKQVHTWRERRSCRGELLQWDTSIHAWLEARGPQKMYLIAGIDDATNALFARFVEADSAEHHMRVLWEYIERHGRPQAIYTDKAGLFSPRWRRDGRRRFRGRRRRRNWGERSGSWGWSGSRRILRRPRGVWNVVSAPCRIAW
jgi:transposase